MTAVEGALEIGQEAERFLEEFMREEYLVGAGLKTNPQFAAVFERHTRLLNADVLSGLLQDVRSGVGHGASESDRQRRILADWLITVLTVHRLAPAFERLLAWQAQARVSLPDGTIMSYNGALIDIANETDPARRRLLDDARAQMISDFVGASCMEQLREGRRFVEDLGVERGYIRTWELLKGISLARLRDQAEGFLKDTQVLWDRVHPAMVRDRLGIDPTSATRADSLALFRAPEFDQFFPAAELQPRVFEQVWLMGCDPLAEGRIILDTEDRPTKRSRAFCGFVRVPEEVYLVTRPIGGHLDWRYFLHEMGHALHFANTDDALPIEFRKAGDYSVTETYASLFEHRLDDEAWLRRFSRCGDRSKEFIRFKAFEELHFIRRYCGRLIYEMELYGGAAPSSPISWDDLPDRYVELMSAATGFRHRPEDAFVDVDPRFYSAYYLRASQLYSTLRDVLIERFGSDWWANPRTGEWLIDELFVHGMRESGEILAQRIAGASLSFESISNSLHTRLS